VSDETPVEHAEPIATARTRRNAAFSFAAQMVTSGGTAILTLYLVRALHPKGYGTFTIAVAISGLALVIADMGLASSGSRYIAENRTSISRVREVFGDTLRIKLALSGAIALILIAAAGPIASAYNAPGLAWAIRAIALSVVGQNVMMFATGAFNALRRVSFNVVMIAGESFAETTASIVLVVAGLGAGGAALGRAIGYVFGGTLGLALVVRTIGTVRLRASDLTRKLVGYAGALLLIDAAFTLFSWVDVFVISAYLNTSAVGSFSAPMRVMTFLTYPGLALAAAVAPQFARTERDSGAARNLNRAIRLLLIGHVAIAGIVLVWAKPIGHLLIGNGYAHSVAVFRALTPFILLCGIAPLVSLSINYLGFAKQRLPIAAGTVIVNLVIDLILVPKIGVVAGAIGTDVAYIGYVLGHVWLARRTSNLNLSEMTLSAARCLVAGAVMAASLLLWGTNVSIPILVLGGAVGLAVYGVMLLASGEVRVAELLGLYRGVVGRFAPSTS
jgi:O-antigen/teichoic acid export membrane protein